MSEVASPASAVAGFLHDLSAGGGEKLTVAISVDRGHGFEGEQ